MREIYQEFREELRTNLKRKPNPCRKSDKRLRLCPIIAEEIKKDSHLSCRKLGAIHDVSLVTIEKIFKEDLNLKSVNDRYVPHFLSQEKKNKRVMCSREFLEASKTRNIKQRMIHADEIGFFASNGFSFNPNILD